MRVAAIRPRRKGLSALVFEGQPADAEPLLFDTETLQTAGIAPGADLTGEQLDALQAQGDRRRAFDRALYILGYRDHTRAELERKLRTAGFSPEAIEAALHKVEELGLINEADYAARLARELLERKGFSARRTLTELARRGVDRETAAAAVAAAQPDPLDQLAALLRRKYDPLPTDEKGRRRMINALLRLGYGYGEIRTALARAGEQTEGWNDSDE